MSNDEITGHALRAAAELIDLHGLPEAGYDDLVRLVALAYVRGGIDAWKQVRDTIGGAS